MAIIEVNGEDVEFPDDMSDADIEAVLQKQYAPPKSEGLESKAVRLTQGALDPVFGIAQAVPHALSAVGKGINAVIPNDYINGQMAGELAAKQDTLNKGREDWYQQAKANEGITGFDGMRMLGNALSPANLMVAAPVAKMSPATTLLGKMGQGAVAGAAYGATAPVASGDYAEEKAKQAGMGAAFGGTLPLAGEALARMIKPKTSKNVETLISEGIRPTPGQILGGAFQKAEDKLTSVPILGDGITKARQRGVEDLNRAVANRALEPLGMTVPDKVSVGHDLVNYVDDTLGKAYDDIIPNLTGKVDDEFTTQMAGLSDMVTELPEAMQKQFNTILKNQVTKKISNNGTITGESLKEMESVLGQKARGYMKSQDFDQRQLGDAVRQAQANIREWLARQNPQHADQLRKINEGWANYTRLRDSAGALGAKEGVFTPAQLSNRVKAMGGRNQYAKGDALMQDLSNAAKDVLPSQYPDSGSIGRLLMGAGALGGGAAVSPPSLAALLLGAGMYSRPGVAATEALLTKRPQGAQAVADGVRKLTSPSDFARLLMGSRVPSTP